MCCMAHIRYASHIVKVFCWKFYSLLKIPPYIMDFISILLVLSYCISSLIIRNLQEIIESFKPKYVQY